MKYAVVVPCFNERLSVASFAHALYPYVPEPNFVMFVDDGSTDGTWERCRQLRGETNLLIDIAHLPRNRGHQYALLRGLMAVRARCDAAITLDADGQHDPAAIPLFLEKFRQGYDIVLGVRKQNPSFFSRLFYRLMGNSLVPNHGDYRLISAKVLATLTEDSEPFLRGLFANTQFKTTTIEYDEQPRIAGKSTYTFRKRVALFLSALRWRFS